MHVIIVRVCLLDREEPPRKPLPMVAVPKIVFRMAINPNGGSIRTQRHGRGGEEADRGADGLHQPWRYLIRQIAEVRFLGGLVRGGGDEDVVVEEVDWL